MAQSRLWKATLLANNSRYFPQMVQAASWHLNKEYTNHMLRKVASTIAIVDALNIPDGGRRPWTPSCGRRCPTKPSARRWTP